MIKIFGLIGSGQRIDCKAMRWHLQVSVGRLRQVLQHLSRRSQVEKLQGLSKVLEIDWAHVKGIDFANRLCEDGRLVLEAGAFQQLTFTQVSGTVSPDHVNSLLYVCL